MKKNRNNDLMSLPWEDELMEQGKFLSIEEFQKLYYYFLKQLTEIVSKEKQEHEVSAEVNNCLKLILQYSGCL
jgi:hypothetical protein